ncbi:MAG: pimeloyl-ACP methyl ester carboxylesterase, partial [Salibacteraceae bacterium]
MNKSVPFKEGKIRYTDTGKGRAVVFLHGFLESHEMW